MKMRNFGWVREGQGIKKADDFSARFVDPDERFRAGMPAKTGYR